MSAENDTWIMQGVDMDDPRCIHTVEQLMDYIDQIGFLPLFRNDIPGFSVEEHTVAQGWWSGDPDKDPWIWREIIARSGRIAYGKFFGKKAGFVSKDWFPCFANFRRDGYDFDALWDDEKASRAAKKIMDLFEAEEELFSFEVKKRAGFGKEGEKNFEGVAAGLQMQTYLCVKDFRQKRNKTGKAYGWSIAVYTKPEQLWGYDYISRGYGEEPAVSYQRMAEHLKKLFPESGQEQIRKIVKG